MLSRLSLATLLLALPLVASQGSAPGGDGGQDAPKGPDNLPTLDDKPGDESQREWPQWVTNDYPCVIECCQGFNGAEVSRDPNPDLEGKARQCVVDKCNKDSAAENLYQLTYIIQASRSVTPTSCLGVNVTQLFYHTGSIYECDGKPCAPSGEAPASTASSGQGGVHAATSAVSIPPVSNGETATVVETASAVDASASDGASEDTSASATAESASSGNGSSRTGWGVGLAVVAVGVAIGAGGFL